MTKRFILLTQKNISARLQYLPLAVILVINAVFLNYNAFRCFNFFDMGSFLDASWRVYKGQLPFVDFIYFAGPIHLYLNAFFFVLFGFGKTAILAHLVSVSSIVIVITYLVVQKFSSKFAAALAAALSAACFYWPISHPWYDQTAHFWGIIAIGILILSQPITSIKRARWIGFACGFLVVFSFFSKTNIGALYGAAFLLTLACMPLRWVLLFDYCLGILIGSGLNLIIARSPSLYFEQVFTQFGLINIDRLSDLFVLKNWLSNGYWAMGLLIVIFLLLQKRGIGWQTVFFFSILGVAIGSSVSASMIREANIPLQGILMGLTFVVLSQPTAPDSPSFRTVTQKALTIAAYFCSTLLLAVAIQHGFELKVWTYIGKPPQGNYAIQTKVMRGWMCDRDFGQDLDAMAAFINQSIPKQESLLILSDMQILYPLTQRDSYRGIPFIFTQGKMPTPGKQLEQVRRHIMNHPPDWIITHLDYSFNITYIIQYLDLFEFLQTHYNPVKRWNHYALLKKKTV